MTIFTDAYTWKSRDVHGPDGEKIGTVKEIYETALREGLSGRLSRAVCSGLRSHFVPLAGAQHSGEHFHVNVTKEQVKDAPSIEEEGQLSEEEERRLFEHYGVSYTSEGSTTAQNAPAGGWTTDGYDVSGPTTDDAMTPLRGGVAGRDCSAGARACAATQIRGYRAGPKKVPVQREEVRVEREPITDENIDRAMDGPDISDEEHEVVLHERSRS